MLDFITIYSSLDFLSESVRMQYSNFILRHADNLNTNLLQSIVNRLKNEEPVEYILSTAEFSGLNFYVDNRCLIPRPETQEIVSKAVEFINSLNGEKCTVIDVGTGSGCIVLSIATYLKKMLVLGSSDLKFPDFIGLDVSKDALEVAKINRKRLKLEENVQFLETDFRDFDFSKYENLIVCSNLPYIPNSDILQKSVINFEPHLALFGGEKGDELNQQLISELQNIKNIKLFLMEGYNGKISLINY